MRKITVNGVEHQFKIGGTMAVIRFPDGKSEQVELSALANKPYDIIERGRRKRTSDGMITPKMVAGYITRHYDSVLPGVF